MLFLHVAGLGLALPAAVTAGVRLTLRLTLGRDAKRGLTDGFGGLAIAAGYLAAHAAIAGPPPFLPVETTQWLFHLVAAAGILCALEALSPRPVWLWRTVRLGLAGGLVGVTLRPLAVHRWSPLVSAAWISSLTAAALVWSLAVDRMARRPGGRTTALALAMTSAASAVAIGMSRSAMLGQLAGALAAALAALTAATWSRTADSPGGGIVPVVATALAGIWLGGYFYAELPAASAILLPAAPLAAWIRRAPPLARLGARRSSFLALAATGLALAWAILPAALLFFGEGTNDYEF